MLDQIQCEFQERYHFDTHMDLLWRNMLKPSSAFTFTHYVVDDEAECVNFVDHVMMMGDEYGEHISDQAAVEWKMWVRRDPNLTVGDMLRSIVLCFENFAFGSPGSIQVPFERFNKYYRGLKEAHLDLRRQKGTMHQVFDEIHNRELVFALQKVLDTDTSHFATDVYVSLLSHAFMSKKQWDEFFWPYLKPQLDTILASGKNCSALH